MYNKLTDWYLSRKSVPYWCMLLVDCCIVFLSGLASYAFNHGLSDCVSYLGTLVGLLIVCMPCFWAGFRLFHTYSDVLRELKFNALVRSLLSVAVGCSGLCLLLAFFHVEAALLPVRFRDLLLMAFFASAGMCDFRVLVKVFYDLFLRDRDRGSVYGMDDSMLLRMEMEELLPRAPIRVDMDAIRQGMCGRRILVTGAAGSIGSELSRMLADFHPAKLVLVDQAETPLHDLRMELSRKWPQVDCVTIVTSICHGHRMEHLFRKYRPEIIFHAAAYKHVPMMEDNPVESVLNNVDGTRKMADLAVKYGVSKFIMISTDKAVNPTSVMGCSKRICEIYCQSLAKGGQSSDGPKCQFVTTRFGNVLGSNGSVIPTFREQIRRGGPVTVTHPDIVRYFMLIPEACMLVLEAAVIGENGEILAFDMGKAVRIADLARRMIRLCGRDDIAIEYTGLRPGEKLYEEVLGVGEKVIPTSHEKIKVAQVREYDFASVSAQVDELLRVARSYDAVGTIGLMKRIVPEYHRDNIDN